MRDFRFDVREHKMLPMRVDVNALRQQAWRADVLYANFMRYAKQIGCHVVQDEIVSTDTQARLLANWWQENAS